VCVGAGGGGGRGTSVEHVDARDGDERLFAGLVEVVVRAVDGGLDDGLAQVVDQDHHGLLDERVAAAHLGRRLAVAVEDEHERPAPELEAPARTLLLVFQPVAVRELRLALA